MDDGDLIVPMRFVKKGEVSLEPVLPFKSFNLVFHDGEIGRHLERYSIMKMDVVVWLALYKVNTLLFQRCSQIMEGFMEETREQ